MTTYDKGDVVLVSMPFTDRSGSKVRPSVIVSGEEYNRRTPDVLIASVTGNLGAAPHPGDHRVSGWKSAGLLKPSMAQTKIAAVATSVVRRKIGRLDAADLTAFSSGLKKATEL